MRSFRVLSALFLTVLLSVPQALAQQAATVQGTVTDAATGAPLADAQVTIAGTALQAVTDMRGGYAPHQHHWYAGVGIDVLEAGLRPGEHQHLLHPPGSGARQQPELQAVDRGPAWRPA